jgi:predicted Holliday junction resolvase-like endonuclease
MDTVAAELVSFLEALESGSLFHYLILLAVVLIGLALIIVAVAYPKRFHTASKATQENSETIAADLRRRALEVKKQDERLRKRDLEVKEEPQLPQQKRQVLKRSQRALKGSVSHIIAVGLKDLERKPDEAALKNSQPGRQTSTQ